VRVGDKSAPLGEGSTQRETATGKHLEHNCASSTGWSRSGSRRRAFRCTWSRPPTQPTLLELARVNHVDLIVLGAPLPSQKKLGWWRSAASTVTANAPCSVHVVRVPERPPL
jgi:hypothetical protein